MDLHHNGDTLTDASSAASSWQSDTPLLRDFDDYDDFPAPHDSFDEAGMKALLEDEFLQSMMLLANLQLSPDVIER